MDVRAHEHYYDHFATLDMGVRTALRRNTPVAPVTTPGGAAKIETTTAPETQPAPDPNSTDDTQAQEGVNNLAADAIDGNVEAGSDTSSSPDVPEVPDAPDADSSNADLVTGLDASGDVADSEGDTQSMDWRTIDRGLDDMDWKRNFDDDGTPNGDGRPLFGPGGVYDVPETGAEGDARIAMINAVIADPSKLRDIIERKDNGNLTPDQVEHATALLEAAERYGSSENVEQEARGSMTSFETALRERGFDDAANALSLSGRATQGADGAGNLRTVQETAVAQDMVGLPQGVQFAPNINGATDPAAAQGGYVTHVQPGDSYWTIGERLGMDPAQIQRFREINQTRMINYEGGNASTTSYFAMIQAGDQLILPDEFVNPRVTNYAGALDATHSSSLPGADGTTSVPEPQGQPGWFIDENGNRLYRTADHSDGAGGSDGLMNEDEVAAYNERQAQNANAAGDATVAVPIEAPTVPVPRGSFNADAVDYDTMIVRNFGSGVVGALGNDDVVTDRFLFDDQAGAIDAAVRRFADQHAAQHSGSTRDAALAYGIVSWISTLTKEGGTGDSLIATHTEGALEVATNLAAGYGFTGDVALTQADDGSYQFTFTPAGGSASVTVPAPSA